MRRVATVAALVHTVLAASPSAQEFSNPTAGISLSPPNGWSVVSMQQVMDNRSKVRLNDSQLQAGLQNATAPLFVFAKYPEPHQSLNPTLQVVMRPRPASLGTSPTAILSAATQSLQRVHSDFRVVEPVRSTHVSGMPAAYMKATYTLRTQNGASHRILSRTWLVPRGAYMFLIGMSGTAEGEDVCDAEFAAALASIVIER